MEEISHKEIYDRLCLVEQQVKTISSGTSDLLTAFHAAQGAFKVLEWLSKIVKPLLVIGAFCTALVAAYNHRL